MASLIKTNKISTPGGEEFTLPTTYPSAKVDLTSTSGGQLGYGSANPVTDRMETSSTTSETGEVFCDKARVNNASAVVSNVTLNCLPNALTDVNDIARTRLHFSGVCFTGNARPCIQLLDASDNVCWNGNFTGRQRWQYSYGGGNSQESYSRNASVTNLNEGFELSHPQLTELTGGSQSGEIFTKTAATNNLAMLGGELQVSQYNKEQGYQYDHFLIEAVMVYNNNATFSTTSSVNWVKHTSCIYYNGYSSGAAPIYTKLKFYDRNSENINEGMFMTYSHINSFK